MTSISLIKSGDSIIRRIRQVNTRKNSSVLNDRSITTNESSVIPTEGNVILKKSIPSKYQRFFVSGNKTSNKKIPLPVSFDQELYSILGNADSILKERTRMEGLSNGTFLQKSKVLKMTDELRTKNYLIKKIKEKRKEINEKEAIIKGVLKDTERIFSKEYTKFIDFVQDNEKNKKMDFEYYNDAKSNKEATANLLHKEKLIGYKLDDELEKTIKDILTLKNYGSFVHDVFGSRFVYDSLPTENKNYRKIAAQILKISERDSKMSDDLFSKLENEEEFLEKYNEYEDKVVSLLHEKERLLSEIKKEKKNNDIVLKELRFDLIKNEKDYKEIEKDKNEMLLLMKGYKNYNEKEVEEYLDYFVELAEEIGITLPKNKNSIEYLTIYDDTMKGLEKKEEEVNNYLEEIEKIMNSGDSENRKIIEDLIWERKKQIKNKKQAEIKKMQEEMEKKEIHRILERAQKIVIKGRNIENGNSLPLIKTKNKRIKFIKKDNDYEYLYYYSEDN